MKYIDFMLVSCTLGLFTLCVNDIQGFEVPNIFWLHDIAWTGFQYTWYRDEKSLDLNQD